MSNRAVVITGTSTGIGKASALYLDKMGFQVFAGVRKTADGDALKQEASSSLMPIILDVTDAASIETAASAVREATGGILCGLVNNAGIGIRGPLEFVPIAAFDKQLQVNLVGQLAVTQAFMPSLRRGQGRILFVSSISGRLGPPFLGLYAASKSGLETIANTLRIELRPWKIQVSTLVCGSIRTPIWEKGRAIGEDINSALPERGLELYAPALSVLDDYYARIGREGISSDGAARIVAHALTAKRARPQYLVGPDARMYDLMVRWLPVWLCDWAIVRRTGLWTRLDGQERLS
jgi:NAD(P)-dependent dehydrogenase (short-subunit alcohol dehydrogenase family)